MRGFKRCEPDTIAYQFLDEDSFISMPKTIPDCPNIQHMLLGPKDKGWQRERLHNRAKGKCEGCGTLTAWVEGEWSHKAVKPADRCDCIEASDWFCGTCHYLVHEGRRPWATPKAKSS